MGIIIPGLSNSQIRGRVAVLVLLVSHSLLPTAEAYSVLTHEQLIDLSWKPVIVPILLRRFPSLTSEQLRRSHSYAYGGCAIQDLGYYPFGDVFFSNLTHYVRSGDFVLSLFRNARTADELAFATGALSHYIGDSIGHSQATNPSVADEFPKLRAKFGPSVSYAQGKSAHGRVEFAFDVDQIAKKRLPPAAYLRDIGLRVPRVQLRAAFYETYGFHIRNILGKYRAAVRTYRFGVRSFLPSFAYGEVLLHRRGFPDDLPGPELDLYRTRIAQLDREGEWYRYRRGPSARTYLLAGLIVILPKIGPIAMLSIKGPTVDTEKRYIESVNRSTEALGRAIEKLAARAPAVGNQSALPDGIVPNRDLDTGERVLPGGYVLTDETYAKLLAQVTRDSTQPVPAGLKQDILRYYSDPDAPISTKRNRKQWAEVRKDLEILTTIPVRPEPE